MFQTKWGSNSGGNGSGTSGGLDYHESCVTLYPNAIRKTRWDFFIMACILYSAIIVPIRVCFDADAEGLEWLLEALISLCFLADVALTFLTAYFAEGRWVTDRTLIARKCEAS